MLKKSKILSEKLSLIEVTRFNVSIFPMASFVDASTLGLRKIVGDSFETFVMKFEGKIAQYFAKKSEMNRFCLFLFNKAKTDPLWTQKLFVDIKKAILSLEAYAKSVPNSKHLKKIDNKALLNKYKKFADLYYTCWCWTSIIYFLNLGNPPLIIKELKKCLKKRSLSLEKQNFCFSLFTKPTKFVMPPRLEAKVIFGRRFPDIFKQIELRRILMQHKSCQRTREKLKVFYPDFLKKFKAYIKKTSWINYGYEGSCVGFDYWLDFAKDFVNRKPYAAEYEVRSLLKDHNNVAKKQNMLFHALKINSLNRGLFGIARELVYLRNLWYKKKIHSNYLFEPVLREISRRTSLSLDQIRMLFPNEVGRAIETGIKSLHFINDRKECFVYGRIKGKRIKLSAKHSKRFLKMNVKIEPKKGGQFNGISIYPGKAKGKAKVITSLKDLNKIKKDDILISYDLSLDFIPIFKKIKAIVTEEGGFASHAFVIAKEFKIICLSGIKGATTNIKDGDLIEVDAIKSVVKKVKVKDQQ